LPRNDEFIILGESFSGPIAVSVAASKPKGLIGLVLCSTFIRNPRPVFKSISRLIDILPVKALPDVLLNYLLMGHDSTPILRSTLKAALSQNSNVSLKARLKSVLAVDVSAKLQTVHVPLLYLQAAQDKIVPVAAGKHMADTYPDTQIVVIDAPHFLLQLASNEAARVVKAFVDNVNNGRFGT